MAAAGLRAGGLHAADAHAPEVRAALQVFPLEVAGHFVGELVVKRARVMVVDQFQGLARSQAGEGFERLQARAR